MLMDVTESAAFGGAMDGAVVLGVEKVEHAHGEDDDNGEGRGFFHVLKIIPRRAPCRQTALPRQGDGSLRQEPARPGAAAPVNIAETPGLSKQADSDNMDAGRLNSRKDGVPMRRRDFVRLTLAGAAALPFTGCETSTTPEPPPGTTKNALFRVNQIPADAFTAGNRHTGVDTIIKLMGQNGLKFYRTGVPGTENGTNGLIAADDIVLIKVNAQWKYRGCTNGDLVRGLIQRILEHPQGFQGEVVIVENGQGRGSLACDTSSSYGGNTEVHANAQNESHSFVWLVDSLFRDPRVSAFLLDPVRGTFIGADEHQTDGYRRYENVSYPCFTTSGGRRVELREGIWNGASHGANLKLINVPVLKHHDTGGSETTGALKHVYGLVSMSDGQSGFRHYGGLGETCGKMMVSVHTPVLNIMDAIWVSHGALAGYPASATYRADTIVASQDPVALDYWTAKNILHPIDGNDRHHPDFPGIDAWLTAARDIIVSRGGFAQSARGILVESPTKAESEMVLHEAAAGTI